MILKVLIVFDPKLNLFKSDAYIFMQQSPSMLMGIAFYYPLKVQKVTP